MEQVLCGRHYERTTSRWKRPDHYIRPNLRVPHVLHHANIKLHTPTSTRQNELLDRRYACPLCIQRGFCHHIDSGKLLPALSGSGPLHVHCTAHWRSALGGAHMHTVLPPSIMPLLCCDPCAVQGLLGCPWTLEGAAPLKVMRKLQEACRWMSIS